MKRVLVGWFVSGFFALITMGQPGADTTQLKPKDVNGREARVVAELLANFHYRKVPFSDSLSSVIFDSYLKELDDNRSYFLLSDVKALEKYRFSIDDLTKAEDVSAAFEIYKVFRERAMERMEYVLGNLIKQNFDYSKDEYFEAERENAPWAASKEELNDIWRKTIKNQALSLKLSGKKPEDIQTTLKTRFERYQKTIRQFNSEDVFGVYMNAITLSYDPHTNYLSPKASDLFKQSMSLSLEGIGARLQTDNDYTKVFEIIPGGPADKSKMIHVNDFITAVAQGDDGELVDVVGWRVDEVVKLIKGPKGTVVRLQIIPAAAGVQGPSEIVRLVREKIKLEDQAAKKKVIHYQVGAKDVKLGVITLPNFYMDFDAYQRRDPNYRSTTRDVKKLVGELKTEGMDGLVIDLRNNGGGSLAEAIDLTGLFIKNGPVVQVKNSDNRVELGVDDDHGVVYNGPLVVLTNSFSASASEIFAGAIQDYHRGVIVGESTYGKGTVQTVIDLKRFINTEENIGELKITYQKFYRVTGSSTQNKGVTPDILIPTAFESIKFGESSNPSALPWDVIRETSYQKTPDVNHKLIFQLNKSYQDRSKYDEQLKKYLSDTEELKKSFEQTRFSLSETVRKKEIDDAEKRKAANSALDTKVNTKDGLPADDLTSLKDAFLREGLIILSELIAKRVG